VWLWHHKLSPCNLASQSQAPSPGLHAKQAADLSFFMLADLLIGIGGPRSIQFNASSSVFPVSRYFPDNAFCFFAFCVMYIHDSILNWKHLQYKLGIWF
jgi:hypothetical protein